MQISWMDQLKLILLYIGFCVTDAIDRCYLYMMLALPKYMFGPPIYRIRQYPKDDIDDETLEPLDYTVFISNLECSFKNSDNSEVSYRSLSGSQLRPLIDEKGRFFLGKLLQVFPTLDMIRIEYIKTCDLVESSNEDDLCVNCTKYIDVQRRYDVHNEESCMRGVVF